MSLTCGRSRGGIATFATVKSRFAVVAAAVICLGTGSGSAVSAEAVSAPHASAGLLNESYTSARADFGITLSAEAGLASYDVRRADSSMLAGHRAAWAFPPKLQAVPVGGADASPR